MLGYPNPCSHSDSVCPFVYAGEGGHVPRARSQPGCRGYATSGLNWVHSHPDPSEPRGSACSGILEEFIRIQYNVT